MTDTLLVLITIGGWTVAIIAIIVDFRLWGEANMLSEENLKLNKKIYDLEQIKLAPHLNIILSDTFIKSEDKEILHIHIDVENSGGSEANFPKCYWKLTSQNGQMVNSGGWLNFPLFGGKSYIEPHSDTIKGYYTHRLSKEEKDEIFNIAHIWLKCTDMRNKIWCSYAHFGPDEKGRLITIVENKVWMVKKRQPIKK